MSDYVLGIDFGTESVRAAVYDTGGGCAGIGVSPIKTVYRQSGWAEQSVPDWRRAVVEAVRIGLSSSGIDPGTVRGIGFDGTTCTLVFLDERGRPLRDAILWMDVRAAREAVAITDCGGSALDYVAGGRISAEWFPCKALWVRRNEPDIYRNTATLFELTDWLLYLLTGRKALNINTVSVRWLYNVKKGGFPFAFFEAIGLKDVQKKIPDDVLPLGAVAGTLLPSVGEEMGLPAGLPVAVGGGDAFVGLIGVNATKKGQLAMITGSSHVQLSLLDTQTRGRGLFGTYPDAILPGKHLVEGGQSSTGSILNWYVENFLGSMGNQIPRDMLFSRLSKEAEQLPPGSEGLVVLDHWQGNRTPWTDPTSRGVISGLSLSHTPAHIYRAIMEGVAYGTAVVLQTMEKAGISITEIIACGGATNSPLWMQIHADATGRPMVLTEEAQAVSLGAGILAAVAAGMYKSIEEAALRMVKVRETVLPARERTDAYRHIIERYVRIYEALCDDSPLLR